jgi:leucyl/phenylalanyl-tRNA--protein transferase
MPVYRLSDKPVFPPPELAEENGLLAIGGDLSPERLLAAYSSGIFPWFSEGEPILWWAPSPRLVIFPDEFRIPRRLARLMRQERFTVTFDTSFARVIEACAAESGRKEKGTWLTGEMIKAYCALHDSRGTNLPGACTAFRSAPSFSGNRCSAARRTAQRLPW